MQPLAQLRVTEQVATLTSDRRAELKAMTLAQLRPIAKDLLISTKLKKARMVAEILRVEGVDAAFD